MKLPITRSMDFFACLVGFAVLGGAYYLELSVGLQPCPLCMVQRYIMLLLCILFLLGGLLPLTNFARRFYHFFVWLITSVGVGVAARHIWLLFQPPGTAPSCEASLSLLVQYLPLKEVALLILQGTGDCDKAAWYFLDLNLPEWSLVFFSLLWLVALWQIFYKQRNTAKPFYSGNS